MSADHSFKAWLLIRDLERAKWADSPCPSVFATLEGQFLEDVYAPGLVFGFPSLSKAARAALRAQPYLDKLTQNAGAPPMVLDVGGDMKRMASVAFGMKPETIMVTDEGAALLAGEPIEMFPGPEVTLDGGAKVQTHHLRISSHNIGWAAPTLDTQDPAFSSKYLRKTEPNVIHIHWDKEKRRSSFRVPWKLVLMLGVLFLFLFGAFRAASHFSNVMKAAHQQSGQEDPEIMPIAMVEEIAEEQVEFSNPTPVPPGYGTIIIRVEPNDAEVVLNDHPIRQEPPIVLEKQSNQTVYHLSVSRSGFKPYTNIFNLDAKQEKEIVVRLDPLPPDFP